MRVLDADDGRPGARVLLEQTAEHLELPFLQLEGCEPQRPQPGLGPRKAQELGDQGRRLLLPAEPERRQVGLEPAEPCRVVVRGAEARPGLDQADHRVERRGAEKLQAVELEEVGVGCHLRPPELGQQTRLADPGLADDMDDPPAALRAHRGPVLRQRPDLALAPDHDRSTVLEAPRHAVRHGRRGQDLVDGDEPRQALDAAEPLRPDVEQPGRQVERLLRDQDRARARLRLQPRREVGGLADDAAGLLDTDTAGIDDDQPGMDTDADRQRGALGPLQLPIQPLHACDDGEARPHRALGIVLMRDRVPEARHHAVPGERDDGTPELPDAGRAEPLVPALDLAQLLGVELLGERCPADEIAEEDRQVAAFGHSSTLCSRPL